MNRRTKKYVIAILLLAGLTIRANEPATSDSTNAKTTPTRKVQLHRNAESIRVEVDGQLFTEYFFKQGLRPYLYPIIGPGGDSVVRDWPMRAGENDAQDHPHHRSVWFAHGTVNGIDFWHDQEDAGRIVLNEILKTESGEKSGTLQATHDWKTNDNQMVCTDMRTIRFEALENDEMLIDFEITVKATHGRLTFGDDKEGCLAIRVTPTMRVKGKVGQGQIVNSEGKRNGNAWGQRAKWCDYSGPVKGKVVGVAIFDHPENLRHPTWWHVREYGLFAANPFGQHFFEKKEPGTGDFTLEQGEQLSLKYRFYFHHGNTKEANVEAMYQNYARQGDKQPQADKR